MNEGIPSLTLKSLLNKLACLIIFSTVKQASLFNRDLRVCSGNQGAKDPV